MADDKPKKKPRKPQHKPKHNGPNQVGVGKGKYKRLETMSRKPQVEFTMERKLKYLDYLRGHPDFGGRFYLCAEAVGSTAQTILDHRKKDPAFDEAVKQAHQAWIDENLFAPALQRARDGIEKKLLGGKFRDEVVATERVYSDSLMIGLLKSHRPEFRDNAVADVGDEAAGGGNGGGVMIVPAAPTTITDWQDRFGELSAPDADE